MNPFILTLFFSAALLAQTNLGDETYKSKKNAFQNKHAEVMKAYEGYWEARKNLQSWDMKILQKEKDILTKEVLLENVKRSLETEKQLKKQLDDSGVVNKETVFMKSTTGFVTADVNDPEFFAEPVAGSGKICMKDKSRCFPYKEVNGKRMLVLDKKEINVEKEHLKSARSEYNKEINANKLYLDSLIKTREARVWDQKSAEKNLNKKKENLVSFIKDEKNKAGMNEAFFDRLVLETNKDALFGSYNLDPSATDTKDQVIEALDVNVFGKDTYGLLKDKFEEYQKQDQQYEKLYADVNGLKTNYDLDAPALAYVEKVQFVMPDASLIKREPANEEVLAKEEGGTTGSVNEGGTTGSVNEGGTTGSVNEGGTTGSVNEGGTTGSVNEGGTTGSVNEGGTTGGGTTGSVPEEKSCNGLDESSCNGNCMWHPGDADNDAACINKPKEKEPPKCDGLKEDECTGDCTWDPGDADNDPFCKVKPASDTPTVVKEEESPEALCKKEATAKILELFKDDKLNILGKQFRLTALKTAMFMKSQAGGSSPKAMESIVNKQQAELLKNANVEELTKIYKDHGIETAGAGMEDMIEKMKTGKFNYYSSSSRMTNDEASKMMLILSKSDSTVKFGMADAAIAWAMGQINRHPKGSLEHNKLSLSVHVNKLMGEGIAGGGNYSMDDLDKKAKVEELAIDAAVDGALKTLSQECQNILSENCLIAGEAKQDAFAEMIKTIISKQDPAVNDKALGEYYLEVKDFIGKPSKKDIQETGAAKIQNVAQLQTLIVPNKQLVQADNTRVYIQPKILPQNLESFQFAAGSTLLTATPQNFVVDNKCYVTNFVNNHKVTFEQTGCEE